MKRLSYVASRLVTIVLVIAGASTAARADLAADVNSILQDKLLRKGSVGIEVYRLGASDAESEEVLNLRAQTPLTPASNLKVVTTSAALDLLGPDFRFRTVLLLHDGDLILVGDGDPSFGDAEYLKKAGWKVTTVYENWAAQLKKLNIAAVKDVIVDDSIFDDHFSHPLWPARQHTSRFEAEVAGMNLNANCLDFTILPGAPGRIVSYLIDPQTSYATIANSCITGSANRVRLDRDIDSNQITLSGETSSRGNALVSITIHDPPMFAATVLADTLAASGIKMTGAVKRDRTIRQSQEKALSAGRWQIIGIHETPIVPVLARCNKDSMNLYAESLCKRLGYESTHVSGSWESGVAVVGTFLKKAGVGDGEFKLDDGSGLSRGDAITPHALARVLIYDHFSRNNDLFFASLSIAGVDGTLDDRFRERDLRDLRRRVFGKSGFIEGVSTLCGYLSAKDNRWYVFSIMMNGIPHLSNGEIKVIQEKVIKAIDNAVR